MARSVQQIRTGIINALVASAATLGITIDPTKWVSVPGDISKTDQKLLLLNAVADAQSIEEQQNDAFVVDVENLVKIAAPQTGLWYRNQMINIFQFNSGVPQVPIIDLVTFRPIFNPIVASYKVISFCSAIYGSAGRCLIRVAANSGGLPADLDTIAGAGALAAAQSFVNEIAAPGISYVVSSGKSDWLFLQVDVYYNGLYSGVIFNNVKQAITTFLNNLSTTAFNNNATAIMKISALQDAILSVTGVNDVELINVAARPDSASFSSKIYLVLNSDEIQINWNTIAGYIASENNTSSEGTIPNSTLSDFRVGSSGILNLNCIPE